MKKQFLLLIIITGVYMIKGIINPMTLYTPLTAVIQTAQTAVALQTLITQPLLPAITTPEPPASTASTSIETPITTTTIGANGQTIASNGCYQITSSINYTGENSILTITTSNITIDLNGQTLSYSGDSSQSINGIVISRGLSNITISNGTITGFPGVGILSQGTADQPVNHLSLDRIKVISCNQGIVICNNTNTTITNCITAGNTNPLGTTQGIKVKDSIGTTIQQCMSNNNTSNTGSCYGYFLTGCKTTFLASCTASGNEGAQETAGIYFESMLRNNSIQNCICNGNSSIAGGSYGILINDSEQTYVQNSATQGNVSSTSSFFSYGIQLRNSSRNFIKHNTVDGNDYGIYDNESLGQNTNMFTQNIAYQNTYSDYLRPNSSPLTFIQIQQENLQKMLSAGALDNISIRISS